MQISTIAIIGGIGEKTGGRVAKRLKKIAASMSALPRARRHLASIGGTAALGTQR